MSSPNDRPTAPRRRTAHGAFVSTLSRLAPTTATTSAGTVEPYTPSTPGYPSLGSTLTSQAASLTASPASTSSAPAAISLDTTTATATATVAAPNMSLMSSPLRVVAGAADGATASLNTRASASTGVSSGTTTAGVSATSASGAPTTALDALEALAHASHDPTAVSTAVPSTTTATPTTSSNIIKPAPKKPLLARASASPSSAYTAPPIARSSSDPSRSREPQLRTAATSASDSSSWSLNYGQNSSTSHNSYGGFEALPASTSSYVSSSSYYHADVNASHFFGANAAFSFEDPSASYIRYQSQFQQAGTSIFNRVSGHIRSQALMGTAPILASGSHQSSAGSSAFNNSPVGSWSAENAFAGTSRRYNGESPLGGGRKLKEHSRAMRYSIGVVSRERGMVAMARPKEDGEGRVAVAGRACLRILKVPRGGVRRAVDPNASAISTASIAYRRSRSRGTTASDGYVGSSEDSAAPERRVERDGINEVLDVKLGSRLGGAHLFSDVAWGYAATSTKLATASTNGTVVLWDLNKDGSNRVDQVRHEHDRKVNRILFGGSTGSWVASGGQDGLIKLWDVREGPNQTRKLKTASPVKHLAFSPSSSQPWTLLAACASGTLIRFDVRNVNQRTGGVTDRIAGHTDACLSLDWRDGFHHERIDSAGGSRDGGWVVTSGLDRTIKIWDFSGATIATKPFRTLYPAQPAATVAWHPTKPTELATSPLSLLSEEGNSDGGDTLGGLDHAAAGWKTEIEVWDIRRPHFPKYALKTDEHPSAILYNDDETLWTVSKSNSTFQQHDINADSYVLLDSIPRATPAWSYDGTMSFIDEARTSHDVPFEFRSARIEDQIDQQGLEARRYQSTAYINTLQQFDPEFSASQFANLANSLVVGGLSFAEMCETNAKTYEYAERMDRCQFWRILKIWLEGTTPPESSSATPLKDGAPPSFKPDVLAAAASFGTSPHRLRFPHSSAYANSRWSVTTSPHVGPTDISNKVPLPDFAEESTSSETDSPHAEDHSQPTSRAYYPDLSSTSSDSEAESHFKVSAARKLSSSSSGNAVKAGLGGLTSLRPLNTNGSGLTMGRRSTSSTFGGTNLGGTATPIDNTLEASRPSSGSRHRTGPARPSGSSSENESGEEDGEGMSRRDRVTSLQIARSRRASSSTSDKRRPTQLREAFMAAQINGSRAVSADPTVVGLINSRRGSLAPPGTHARNSNDLQAATAEREQIELLILNTQRAQAMSRRLEEATEIMKRQIASVLQGFADDVSARYYSAVVICLLMYDSQLCAVACCVLQDRDVELDSLFVARVTQAYLGSLVLIFLSAFRFRDCPLTATVCCLTDSLNTAELHIAAASLQKYTPVVKLREKAQTSVTFHTACGNCGKALEGPPFNACVRCSARATRCCICQHDVDALLVFCAVCGHGAHPTCLALYSSAVSVNECSEPTKSPTPDRNFGTRRSSVASLASAYPSHPSTPGLLAPLRAWMWGEEGPIAEQSELRMSTEFGTTFAQRLSEQEELLAGCPSGLCEHSPCILAA
ncbi:BZ3500_MvSof-1268-A1-R1_Chr1-2g01329 [Microbotryum saponariae]|uniref:BZ3500_MvSof-1268-A1-R1_Chr1-2g01329 protein n=1 Tax=Microbotryum saponariae TaxID=289078 RepID=A0A2X0KJW9_9BASI|nr:BZ3500_MvSof-1268-A1-R1_Chr1-2g01329 [Microbotryum saponariae]SCZ97112.1 BZ3501_MvSof-1269-A2-R1_Chr1-2g00928 [Microbotryum saponariae]